MQTCKELRLVAYWMDEIDFSMGPIDDVPIYPKFNNISMTIPSGTYVKKVGHLQYKVNGWKGMPVEYKKAINSRSGVIISHAMVKGMIKTEIQY
jgi:hypothetical protein